MPDRYLTISVDDGHPTDSRTADLLRRFGLEATFYVPATNPERALLTTPALRNIAESFEIGSHTYSHLPLARLPDDVALREIRDGTRWLEDRVGRAVVSFCYPRGKLNRRTPLLVQEAGIIGARTCMLNLNALPVDPYRTGVSTHARAYPRHVQLRHAILEGNLRGALDFAAVHHLASDWGSHFAAALEWVDRHGGVAHLYLHSWEIAANDEWARLEAVLAIAAGYKRLARITNGELFRLGHTTGTPIAIPLAAPVTSA